MGLRTNSIPRSVSFRFFNKIISCGRRREDQGLGPPPLWSVAGEGGLCSGLEGSVGYGGRGLVPRPEPKFGGGGASSFGLRLRTGERCSRRGRSAGAWSWSSCTDTARRPAERGLGLSWPSSFLGPKQGSSGRLRMSGAGLVLRGLGLGHGEGGPGPSCWPQPRPLSSAFSCCPSVFQVADSGPWPPGPGLHEGSADTEWVRDLIEMGGVSVELSIMSPSEPAFLISPSLLCRKQISQTAALVPLLWPYFFVFLKPSYRMDTIGWPEHGKANPFPLTLQSGMPGS